MFFDLVNLTVLVMLITRLFIDHKFKVTTFDLDLLYRQCHESRTLFFGHKVEVTALDLGAAFDLEPGLSMTRSSLVQTVKVTGGLASTGQSTRPSMPRGRNI